MAVLWLKHYIPSKDKQDQNPGIYEKTSASLEEIVQASKKRFNASGVDIVIEKKESPEFDSRGDNEITVECPEMGLKETSIQDLTNSENLKTRGSMFSCPSKGTLENIMQDLLFQAIDLAGNDDSACSGG